MRRGSVSSGLARYRRLAVEGGWIVIGQIATVLGALVLVRVLTERLDPAQYGQLALGLTVAGLVNQVVMGGVGNGIGRFYSIAAEKQDLAGYLRASRRMMLYATLVVLVIGVALTSGLMFLGYSQWMGLAAVTLIFSVLSGYNSTLSGIQNAARQRAIVAFHGGLDAWLKILLALGVMLWLGNSSTAVVIGYALSSLLVTGSQFIFLHRLIPCQSKLNSDSHRWVLQIWAYAWPFSTWGIFTWVQQSSDRWALEAFATTQDVGLYAVLFQLGYTPITIATGLMMSFLGPILYQRSGDATDRARHANTHQLIWRISSYSLFLTLIAFLLGLGLHKWIFTLLTAINYRSISYLLPFVLLTGGLLSTSQIYSQKLLCDLDTKSIILPGIITPIIGVVVSINGAFIFGIEGVIGAKFIYALTNFIWIRQLAKNVAK